MYLTMLMEFGTKVVIKVEDNKEALKRVSEYKNIGFNIKEFSISPEAI